MLHDLDRGHREDIVMSGDHAKDVIDPVPQFFHIEVVGDILELIAELLQVIFGPLDAGPGIVYLRMLDQRGEKPSSDYVVNTPVAGLAKLVLGLI